MEIRTFANEIRRKIRGQFLRSLNLNIWKNQSDLHLLAFHYYKDKTAKCSSDNVSEVIIEDNFDAWDGRQDKDARKSSTTKNLQISEMKKFLTTIVLSFSEILKLKVELKSN